MYDDMHGEEEDLVADEDNIEDDENEEVQRTGMVVALTDAEDEEDTEDEEAARYLGEEEWDNLDGEQEEEEEIENEGVVLEENDIPEQSMSRVHGI